MKKQISISRLNVGDTVSLNFTVARIFIDEFDEAHVLLKDAMGVISEDYTQEELNEAGGRKKQEPGK